MYCCQSEEGFVRFEILRQTMVLYIELNKTLLDLGFTRSTLDKCLYSHKVNGKIAYALVYVDDIFLVGNDKAYRESIINSIQAKFKKITRQPLNNVVFLGMQITKHEDGDISVSQKTLIDKILQAYKITNVIYEFIYI